MKFSKYYSSIDEMAINLSAPTYAAQPSGGAMEKAGHILKTYVNNICGKHLFVIYPTYDGLPIIPSHSAFKELEKYGLMLADVKEILAEGYDCQNSRRKKGTMERCVRYGKKTLKVVVVKSVNCTLNAECWVLTHVGVF